MTGTATLETAEPITSPVARAASSVGLSRMTLRLAASTVTCLMPEALGLAVVVAVAEVAAALRGNLAIGFAPSKVLHAIFLNKPLNSKVTKSTLLRLQF